MDIKDTISYEEFQKDLKLPEPVIKLHNVFFRDFAGSLLSICYKTSGFPALPGIIVRGDVFYDNLDGNGIGAPALYIYYPESNNFKILKISGENASFIYDRIMECQHKRRRRIMLREFVTYLYYCMSFALGCFGFFSLLHLKFLRVFLALIFIMCMRTVYVAFRDADSCGYI